MREWVVEVLTTYGDMPRHELIEREDGTRYIRQRNCFSDNCAHATHPEFFYYEEVQDA